MEHTGDGAAFRTITDLRQTKQGRIAVFFDGEFDFSVDDETLVQYHLAVGKRYTAGQYEQLRLQKGAGQGFFAVVPPFLSCCAAAAEAGTGFSRGLCAGGA